MNFSRMSNSLDPDQPQHFVWPELDPNCLQKLSVDNTSYILVKELINITDCVHAFVKNHRCLCSSPKF